MNSTDGIGGAAPPPPGVTPNFVNPESIAWQLILASCLGPALAIPIVAVRFYTAARILKQYHLDDCEFDAHFAQAGNLLADHDAPHLDLIGIALVSEYC